QLDRAGYWFATLPKDHWPQDAETLEWIESLWDDVAGDCRQEIVFIGIEMDREKIEAGLDEALILALDAKFSTMRSLADSAILVVARYADGRQQPLVGIFGAKDGAEPDMARAITEAAQFSGADVAAVDLVFLPIDHPVAEKMVSLGLKFQIPRLAMTTDRPAPGSDPMKPPILR
ncbi:MAG: GTP-binding protein, partial [Pseudomonadota bacterium]